MLVCALSSSPNYFHITRVTPSTFMLSSFVAKRRVSQPLDRAVRFETEGAAVLALKRDARKAGIPDDRIRPIPPGMEPVFVRVQTAWTSRALDDEWTVAYRLVPQDGRPIVAEVRIFPTEPAVPGWPRGEWSAQLKGVEAKAPPGGLTARKLRTVGLKADVLAAEKVLNWIGSEEYRDKYIHDVGRDPGPGPFAPGGYVEQLGFTRPRRTRHAGSRERSKPGRKPTPPTVLALIARDYVKALSTGRPIAHIAQQRGWLRSQVRSYVNRARVRGFLFPAKIKQGQAAGQLTTLALEVLKATDVARKSRRSKFSRSHSAKTSHE